MFQVLQDFTVFIKGSGYVVAAILLVSFVIFWSWLTSGEDKRRNRPLHPPR